MAINNNNKNQEMENILSSNVAPYITEENVKQHSHCGKSWQLLKKLNRSTTWLDNYITQKKWKQVLKYMHTHVPNTIHYRLKILKLINK